MQETAVVQMVGNADEGYVDMTWVVLQLFSENMFIKSEGFTYLTFHPVTVDGVVKAFLGYGYKHTHRWNG